MRNFREYIIWIDSMKLVREIYELCSNLPNEERFGLISQLCRASISIPSNIAEGSSRSSEVEFKRFLEIALGSSFELETQLLLCHSLGFISKESEEKLIIQLNVLQKQIHQLIIKIKAKG